MTLININKTNLLTQRYLIHNFPLKNNKENPYFDFDYFVEKNLLPPIPTVVDGLVRWGVGMSKPSWLISGASKLFACRATFLDVKIFADRIKIIL